MAVVGESVIYSYTELQHEGRASRGKTVNNKNSNVLLLHLWICYSVLLGLKRPRKELFIELNSTFICLSIALSLTRLIVTNHSSSPDIRGGGGGWPLKNEGNLFDEPQTTSTNRVSEEG